MACPDWIVPMAATLTQDRFSGPDWFFEQKLDGIRLLAFKDDRGLRLLSRNQLPQTLPSIAGAIASLPHRELILDGEVTWHQDGPRYHVFDIVWLDGHSLSEQPIESRQHSLDQLPLQHPLYRVRRVDGDAPWETARHEGWEGVIAKRRGSRYEHRRSPHWLKMKCELAQEFVVGGFTDPQGARVGLGALLVGVYDGTDLVFAGKLGTGFDTALLLHLRARLDALETPASPFTRSTGLPRLRVHWTRPEIVVQAAFLEWTPNGKLRHPRLLGVRTDKPASDVVREDA